MMRITYASLLYLLWLTTTSLAFGDDGRKLNVLPGTGTDEHIGPVISNSNEKPLDNPEQTFRDCPECP